MKKTFTLVALLLVCIAGRSQTRLGIKGGFTLSNIRIQSNINGDLTTENGKSAAGFHLGMISDFTAGKNFHIRPELLIVSKGTTLEGNVEGTDVTMKYRPFYLELPVNFLFHKTFPRSGAAIFLGGGPVLGYGVGGKTSINGQKTDVFNTGGLKRFDMGLGFAFGFDLPNGLTLSMSNNTGLLNIYEANPQFNPYDTKMRMSSFNVSVGYLFH